MMLANTTFLTSAPEVAIASSHPLQHRTPKLLPVRSVRDSPAVTMLQAFAALAAIPCPPSLDLSITQLQELGRFRQTQAAGFPSLHDFHPTQLSTAQSTSPQSSTSPYEAL